MESNLLFLNQELLKTKLGRANPKIFDKLKITIDNKQIPFPEICQTHVKDANSLQVVVPDEGLIPIVEKLIKNANMGLNPQRQGNSLKVQLPKITDELKKQSLVNIHAQCEKSRIFIRKIRQEARKEIQKIAASKEVQKSDEDEIQKITDGFIKQVDLIVKKKEKELNDL
jgi:ribosome recycling factor